MRTFDPHWAGALSMEQVFDKIKDERHIQTKKFGLNFQHQQSVEGYMIILHNQLHEALDGWMKNTHGRNSSLTKILQIAAVAVSCLEDHGIEGN